MYLSKNDFFFLQEIQTDLRGYNAEHMASILEKMQARQTIENARVANRIAEQRKINPVYARSQKEKEYLEKRRTKNG